MPTVVKFASFLKDSGRSRVAWLLVCLHAACFFLAIANMSPPAPAFGEFLDKGGRSSATLFAGRPFHFTYESIFLKVLLLVDMPSMFAALPISFLVFSLEKAFHLGSYSASYVAAALLLLLATCQWLVIGGLMQSWLGSRHWGERLLLKLNRSFAIMTALIILLTAIVVPIINEASQRLGFRHGAISFH